MAQRSEHSQQIILDVKRGPALRMGLDVIDLVIDILNANADLVMTNNDIAELRSRANALADTLKATLHPVCPDKGDQ